MKKRTNRRFQHVIIFSAHQGNEPTDKSPTDRNDNTL